MASFGLMQEATEIKSFSDIKEKEGLFNEFNGRLQTFYDLLTRDDAASTEEPTAFEMSTEGAYGLAWVLKDCITIIHNLVYGYFEIDQREAVVGLKKTTQTTR